MFLRFVSGCLLFVGRSRYFDQYGSQRRKRGGGDLYWYMDGYPDGNGEVYGK